MNKEIEPKSCVISRWEDSDIIDGHFGYGSGARAFEAKSKNDLDTFAMENPEINKDTFLERIYDEFGRNVFANQNLIIACSVLPDVQNTYDIKDILVSDGALSITMNNTFPGI